MTPLSPTRLMRNPILSFTIIMFTAPSLFANGIIRSEFIYENAPFPQCHASTIEETKEGLVAAWFGGTREKNPDVGIWLSRHDGKNWSEPVEVANGVQSPEKRFPCGNPVLFQPKSGPLILFYKVGPSASGWWGMLKTSVDHGRTWLEATKLPDGIWGPVKNKPIELGDGTILCGTSGEATGWKVYLQSTRDLGKTWEQKGPFNDGKTIGAIQPSVLTYPDNRMQLLCRSKQKYIMEVWSEDGGKTWGEMKKTSLPNPNSGTDAVTLKDGRQLLVYNHTVRGRSPLNVAVSKDGKSWSMVLILEDQRGEFSYPAVIQTSDGLVHITYTWKRQRVKHVVLDPEKLGHMSELPKVLLIGDSISLGYTGHVVHKLKNVASVRRVPGNAQHTATGLRMIDRWLGKTEWDVIHFNWGLWDLCYRNPKSKTQGRRDKVNGTVTHTLDHYESNLRKLVERLKKTDATLIWAATTPVPEGELGRKLGDDLKYNAAAAAIMKENDIRVNDLHAHILPRMAELQTQPGNVHFKPEGSRLLGDKVVEEIKAALERRVEK